MFLHKKNTQMAVVATQESALAQRLRTASLLAAHSIRRAGAAAAAVPAFAGVYLRSSYSSLMPASAR